MDKREFGKVWYWTRPLMEDELQQLANISEDQAENSNMGGGCILMTCKQQDQQIRPPQVFCLQFTISSSEYI